jgi:hypothetical protein
MLREVLFGDNKGDWKLVKYWRTIEPEIQNKDE